MQQSRPRELRTDREKAIDAGKTPARIAGMRVVTTPNFYGKMRPCPRGRRHGASARQSSRVA
jgi:hypothetical protein